MSNAEIKISIKADAANVDKTFENVRKGADGVSSSFKKVAPATNQATQSLVNLSRIAQDSPYGLIGIANNLNPLAESFHRLSIEAKESGKSIGNLLKGALVGPAGIGLAIGVVSSLLITFGDKLFKSADAAAEAKKKLDEVKKATQDFLESMSEVNRARLEGINSAEKELVHLDLLYKASQNQALAIGERKKAVDELQRLYPSYFKNIQDETVLAGGATAQYYKLRDSIIATANARAAQESLVDLGKQLNTNAAEHKRALDEEYKALKKVRDLAALPQYYEDNRGNQVLTANGKKLVAAQKEYNAAKEKTLALAKGIFKTEQDQVDIANVLTETISANGVDVIIEKQAIGATAAIKKLQEVIPVLKRQLERLNELPGAGKSYVPTIGEAGKNLPTFNVPQISPEVIAKYKELTAEIQKQADTVTTVLNPAFQNLFQSILAGENPLKAFFDGLGQSINAVIQQLIQAAIKAMVLKIIMGPMGGTATFGDIFKGLIGGATGFGGAANFGSSMRAALGNVNGTSFRGTGMSAPVVLDTRIKGSDLYLVQTQTGIRQNRNF